MNTRTRIAGAAGAVLVVATGVIVYAVNGGNDNQPRQNAIGSVKVAYPDTDLVALKTTGGFLGNTSQYNASSYSMSFIRWSSAAKFDYKLYVGDQVSEGRCMGAWVWGVDARTGKQLPLVKAGEACLVGTGSDENTFYVQNVTAPTGSTYQQVTVMLCRETVDKKSTDSCVTEIVKPGLD